MEYKEEYAMRNIFAILFVSWMIMPMSMVHASSNASLLDFDTLYIPHPSNPIGSFIAKQIPQSGGEMANATVSIREASYVGNMLRFLVVAEPSTDGLALTPYERLIHSQANESLAYGNEVLAIRCTADIALTGLDSETITDIDGRNAVYRFSTRLPDDAPERIHISIDCTIVGLDMNSKHESAVLTFEIDKTGSPTMVEHDVNIDVGTAVIKNIRIEHSPMDYIMQVTYEPKSSDTVLWCNITEPNGTPLMGYGSTIDVGHDARFVTASKWELVSMIPEKLYITTDDSGTSFVLNTQTGEITMH